ncbi:MAG: HlyC/CorC family transporter [Chromatiaceae bacterium]|nr:HlyC/CorC family transporter [Gammaproteobacteria bacterium]MCP5316601.1 HlyC/CorC family transporter [Chromatiaceae bacterium]MCP5429681.1 HlyC/CorC family transporter [Chromatiaceae bacterium]MCP5434092.1 HlyC/CorC family transporter [Chromatiaceae bacterium]HOP15471.1 HlyC/CorC family transporter [Gammaproteobacteria bacterium]
MNDLPLGALFGALVFLLILSAFFSGSETALMTLNRYRLRHLADAGHPGAKLARQLLDKPDRLIGLILLGNNFVNILASSLATIIAIRLGGEGAIAIAAGLLTLVVLIFSEVAPKTMAALYPERIAFPAAWVYTPLLRLLFPLVWLVNLMANTVLRLLGIFPEDAEGNALSREELRTVVNEAGAMIPKRHQKMLLNILDLEKVTVDDIMVPRSEIDGVDLDDPFDVILEQLEKMPYTRVLVYRGSIDHVVGFVHSRRAMHSLLDGELDRATFERLVREPYFIPKGTPLNRQLLNFQRNRRRTALVVDEYGDVQGLVTMADLLEEIVGEFATDPSDAIADVLPQEDGSFLVDGSANLRELVRTMHWELPTDGPKTLNGLIVEYLESLPDTGTSLMVAGYPIEVVQIQDNAVKTARIRPQDRRQPDSGD